MTDLEDKFEKGCREIGGTIETPVKGAPYKMCRVDGSSIEIDLRRNLAITSDYPTGKEVVNSGSVSGITNIRHYKTPYLKVLRIEGSNEYEWVSIGKRRPQPVQGGLEKAIEVPRAAGEKKGKGTVVHHGVEVPRAAGEKKGKGTVVHHGVEVPRKAKAQLEY